MAHLEDAAGQKTAANLPTEATRYAELSRVALRVAKHVTEGYLPAGSQGTIVGIYGNGIGYEVEFTQPIPAVVTLDISEIMNSPID